MAMQPKYLAENQADCGRSVHWSVQSVLIVRIRSKPGSQETHLAASSELNGLALLDRLNVKAVTGLCTGHRKNRILHVGNTKGADSEQVRIWRLNH